MVASRIPEGVRLAQRPRPSGSGGSSVDPAWGNPIYEDLGDSKSAGGARGRWRREGGGFGGFSFSLSRESESRFDFVIIAVFLEFVSVLEKGLRPLVLAINVSKFLPASSCSKRIVGIRSWDIFRIVASVLFFWFCLCYFFCLFFSNYATTLSLTPTPHMYEHAILLWSLGTSRLHSIIILREK